MRAYLGFLPFVLVVVPLLVAAIRQALFYTGCMDGLGYVLVAMWAFAVGGALNLAYVLFVVVNGRGYFVFSDRKQAMAAKAGFAGAVLLLVAQVVVVASIVWRNLAAG